MPRADGSLLDEPPLLAAPTTASDRGAALSQRVTQVVRAVRNHPFTCRLSPRGSAVLVVAGFACIGVVAAVARAMAGWHYRPAPAPPCGTWTDDAGPGDHPCSTCLYGIERIHKVTKNDLSGPHTTGACDTLAARFGVPQFELYDLNTSQSCCENPLVIAVTDLVAVCKPPTLAQWKAEGHPRKAPDKVVFSYIGAVGGDVAPLPTWGAPAGNPSLPESINVAAVGPLDDTTNSQGIFRVTPPDYINYPSTPGGFAANCSMQINPSRMGRGNPDAVPPGTEADRQRVWLGTLLPVQPGFRDNGNWCLHHSPRSGCRGALSPEEWGANAAESMEKIFLRYRLDGLDLNIEDSSLTSSSKQFAQYICSMFRQLQERMGPGLIFTVTPFSHSWAAGMYQAVAAECIDMLAWANWQTYDDASCRLDRNSGAEVCTLNHPEYTKRAADVFGWNKTTWGLSTQNGLQRPRATAAVQIAEQYPDARGVFVWTAESSAKCDPPWCMEDLVAAKMTGRDLPAGPCACD
eukprot:COSAG02_NODE_4305_length_5528_cov_18.902376_7_plen_519_part_00